MKTKTYLIGKRRVKVLNHADDKNESGSIVGDVVGVAKDIVKGVTNQVKTDAVLIRTRDKIYAIFKKHGIGPGTPALDAAAALNKIGHKDIPNRKVGGNYNNEWARLYKFIIDTLNNAGRDDLAEIWERSVPVFTEKDHDFSYLNDVLNGKFRAVPVPASTKDIASEIENDAIKKTTDAQYAKERGTAGPTLESSNTKILKPFKPLMKVGVSNAGFVPPENIDALALLFYDKVVKPGTQSNYDHCDNLDEMIVDSILNFIAALQAKREAGEPMNKTYEKIADTATKIQEKSGAAAKDIAGDKIGGFVVNNLPLIGIGLAVVIIMLAKK